MWGLSPSLLCPCRSVARGKWLWEVPTLQPGSPRSTSPGSSQSVSRARLICKTCHDSLTGKGLINIRKCSNPALLLAGKSLPAPSPHPRGPAGVAFLPGSPRCRLRAATSESWRSHSGSQETVKQAAPTCWVSRHLPPGANHLAGTVGWEEEARGAQFARGEGCAPRRGTLGGS